MPVEVNFCATREAAVAAAADDIAARLSAAVAARGEALFLATGGVTPIPLYEALSAHDLPWERVTVLPSDARWLAEDQDGSNDGMIRRTLIQGRAASTRFLPLFGPEPTPEAALPRLRALIATLPRADVALLGMGEDGHTASFFKGAEGFEAAIDPAGREDIVTLHAASGAMTPHRLSLTLPALLRSRAIRLFFFGAAKRTLFEQALQPDPIEDLPVRSVLHQARSPVVAWWGP